MRTSDLIDINTFKGRMVAEMLLPCRAYPLKRGRTKARRYKGVYQPLGDQQEMLEHMGPHYGLGIDCPIIVELYCSYLRLFQGNSVNKEITILAYDVDNLAKAILDNMQRAAIIEDDRNVVGVTAIKYLGECDSTTIKIYKAEGYEYKPKTVSGRGSKIGNERSTHTRQVGYDTPNGGWKDNIDDGDS